MTGEQSVSAEWIWTGAGAPHPGTLIVRNGRVVEVSTDFDRGSPQFRTHCLITPGLVNGHVHLDLTFDRSGSSLTGLFTDWLWSIKELREREGRAGLESAAARGLEESLAEGTTTLVDYDSGGYSVAPLARSPIRRWLLREVIAFRPDFDRWRPVLEKYLEPPESERERRGLAPHAPYTVAPKLRRWLVEWARQGNHPWSIHFAEQPWEAEFLAAGTGPFTAFLARVGVRLEEFGFPGTLPIDDLRVRTPGTSCEDWPLLVHANYLDSNAIEAMSNRCVAVVFCPESHRFFGHPAHPLAELRAAGVPVCLGTDGRVSAGSLSLRSELRRVRADYPEITSTDLWSMVTRIPRSTMGSFASGELAVGAHADWVVWQLPGPSSFDQVLVDALDPATTCAETWISGERVYEAP